MVPAEAANSFELAWQTMSFSVEPGRFALLGLNDAPEPADLACLEHVPAQMIRETDETTLLVHQELSPSILARHPDARIERDLVWIRFETPMSWEVVGFLARVCQELAAAGVPIGAVCAFSRDHLFVAHAHLATARSVLERLFPQRSAN